MKTFCVFTLLVGLTLLAPIAPLEDLNFVIKYQEIYVILEKNSFEPLRSCLCYDGNVTCKIETDEFLDTGIKSVKVNKVTVRNVTETLLDRTNCSFRLVTTRDSYHFIGIIDCPVPKISDVLVGLFDLKYYVCPTNFDKNYIFDTHITMTTATSEKDKPSSTISLATPTTATPAATILKETVILVSLVCLVVVILLSIIVLIIFIIYFRRKLAQLKCQRESIGD